MLHPINKRTNEFEPRPMKILLPNLKLYKKRILPLIIGVLAGV
jgi:hypothetical protein